MIKRKHKYIIIALVTIIVFSFGIVTNIIHELHAARSYDNSYRIPCNIRDSALIAISHIDKISNNVDGDLTFNFVVLSSSIDEISYGFKDMILKMREIEMASTYKIILPKQNCHGNSFSAKSRFDMTNRISDSVYFKSVLLREELYDWIIDKKYELNTVDFYDFLIETRGYLLAIVDACECHLQIAEQDQNNQNKLYCDFACLFTMISDDY